jgi:glycerophosphoryl diester phosphodiesterase
LPAPLLVIAHRGDSAHRPENTLAAIAGALELGVSAVEIDVQLTRDGRVVVMHDPTLDRTTSGRGDVRQLSLAEIRALSAGYPSRFGTAYQGEHVPTLAEVLTLVRDRARTLIEIKKESVTDDATGGVEALTIAEIRRLDVADKVALISFDQRAILRARELAPEISRGRIFGRTSTEELLADARATGSEVVLPHKSLLSDDLAARAREAGLKVATWVVDDPEELKPLARFGLYGVGSNRPGVLLDAIADGILSSSS